MKWSGSLDQLLIYSTPGQISELSSLHLFHPAEMKILSPAFFFFILWWNQEWLQSSWWRSFAVCFHVTANTAKHTECWRCNFLKGRWGDEMTLVSVEDGGASECDLHSDNPIRSFTSLLQSNSLFIFCRGSDGTTFFINCKTEMCWKSSEGETTIGNISTLG